MYTKYSKGSKWSHAKPEPLSTDVPPSTKDQSSNTLAVVRANQSTQYETQEPTESFNGSVAQNLPLLSHSASEPHEPRPPQSPSIPTYAPVPSVQAGGSFTSLEAARVTHQPSVSAVEATTAADNQVNVVPTQQDVPASAAQQSASPVTQGSISQDQSQDNQSSSQAQSIDDQQSPAATHLTTRSVVQYDIPSSLQSEAERDRAQQPSSTVAQLSIAVFQPEEESITQDSAQPSGNHIQTQLRYLQQDGSENMVTQLQSIQPGERRNNQPSSTVTQASIPADQPADDNSSLRSARQPDSSHLLQSTGVQQPADMSASLNDHQFGNQPSSTIPLQSLEDTQQPHDDIGSI